MRRKYLFVVAPLHEDGKSFFLNEDGKARAFNNIACYVAVLHPEFLGKKCELERLIELLKCDSGRLERAFGDYLSSEMTDNDGYEEKCKNLCQTNGKGDDGVFVNIHGKLGEDIVFGIDGKDRMGNSVAIPFAETYRFMLLGGSRTGSSKHC